MKVLMGVRKSMNLSARWLTRLSIRVSLICPDLLAQTVHQHLQEVLRPQLNLLLQTLH